ncbi:MAG: PilN domain-containing protein [Paracoccaceae bacterium]
MAACCFLGAVAAGPLLALTLTNQGELTAAKAALEAAQARAAPVMLERNKLLARQDRLNAFKATLVRSGRASAWTNMISEVLPEQAFLTSAEVVDGQISITGEAQSASQILAAFDRVQSLQDVRFTAPVIRLESKGRDRFDLGMQTTPAEPIQ